MSQMLKSSGAMAAATMTSRVLGMVRVMVYASFMGNGWVASAFTLAFMVPNLFRRLLGEGALTAAFIPIFKQKEVKEGATEMWRTANVVISGLIVAAGAITMLAIVGIGLALWIGVYPPNNEHDEEEDKEAYGNCDDFDHANVRLAIWLIGNGHL